MSMIDVDDKMSVMGKSQASLTSVTRASEDNKSKFKFKQHFLSLNKVYLSIWSILFCIIVGSSLIGFLEAVKFSYKKANETTFHVYPPTFLTYFSTSWLLVFYPIQSLTFVFNKENKFSYKDRIKFCFYGLFPERNQKCKYSFRLILLVILWNTFVNCAIRAAGHVHVIDLVILFGTNSPIRYILYWVMMHKKFVALRIISFIISASGMIVNVYINTDVMWYKVLMSLAAVTYSVFLVYSRSFLYTKNMAHLSTLYSLLSLVNLCFTWPIFLFTSIVTNAEVIVWSEVQWSYFSGCGAGLLLLFSTSEFSNMCSPRGIRNILYLLALPVTYLIEAYWVKSLNPQQPSAMRLASLALVLTSILLTSIPSSWLNACSSRLFRKQASPAQVRGSIGIGGRLSMSVGGATGVLYNQTGAGRFSQHNHHPSMSNGGMRMSTSLSNSLGGHQHWGSGPGASQILHRDSSVAVEMLQRIGNFGSHIFSGAGAGNSRGSASRSRVGSIFG